MHGNNLRHVRCQEERGVLVVSLLDEQIQGDQEAEGLRRELLQLAEQHPQLKWLIDFAGVRFFSSAGIRPLLALHRKLQADQRRLVLCQLIPDIEEVFLATRLVNPDRPDQGPFFLASDRAAALRLLKHHEARVENDVLIISLAPREMHGEELAADLLKELQTTLDEADRSRVVLDLERVTVISTPCMRPLLQLRGWLKERGGKAVMCRLDPMVADIFRLTRLIPGAAGAPGLFEAYQGLEEAIAALQSA